MKSADPGDLGDVSPPGGTRRLSARRSRRS